MHQGTLCHYMFLCMQSCVFSDPVVMELAAKVAGRLVSSGGSLAAESVEYEVSRALEWLSADRNEAKRHAAVLVLRELAVNAPTFFFQKVQPFLDHIFNAIRDPKVRSCLLLRENTIRYCRSQSAMIIACGLRCSQRKSLMSS